jgi:uncharacterized membrane protein HdeD (DUF308 family)
MNIEAQLEEGERPLARIWKIMAFQGALAIAFAVVIVVWPDIGLSALVALFGALALLTGIATIAGAVRLSLPTGRRVWLLVDGLVGVAVGVVVFIWPDLSALGLLYAVAAWAIAVGVIKIVLSFELPISGHGSLLLGLGGLLSIAFGVIMIAEPGAGAIALLALVAAFALVTGVMQVAYAIELRRLAGEVRRPFHRGASAKPVAHG